ncbi:uncharacterized protein Dvar_16430 [Desulfosarcina variabilis str. Montpellier]
MDFGLWHFFFIFKGHQSLPTKALTPNLTALALSAPLDIFINTMY